jgi:nitrogen fixation/metabolism regulation signal transduction histidine kinase
MARVTLRARLLLALLAMALVPTAAFTLFTLDQLDRSARRWFRPGVEHALESGLETTRSGLARLEGVALAVAEAWSASRPRPPLDPARRERLAAGLRATGLDVLQLYRRQGGGWRLAEQVVPAGVLAPAEPDLGAEIAVALDSTWVIHSARGVLAGVARVDSVHAIAVGWWVAPDHPARVADIGVGVERYRQLGVLVPIQRRWVWSLVLALVVVLVAAAVPVAGALAGGMSRPLADLSAALARVSAGDTGARVTPRGAAELRGLAESFNAMTARLAEARESLLRAEREAAWRDVARRLAHEIKNPLTAMRYALHRIERRVDRVPEADREAVRQSVEAILREVQDLAFMTEQFSQYARAPEPMLERLELDEVVRSAAALQEPETLAVRAEPVAVRGDRVLVSRAVQNLLVNAREASPAGAVVEVTLRPEGDRAVIEVLDRGAGLPAVPAERLFDPYVSTKNRGSGLGLALVRDVAERHGGGVALENREGGGARARLWLPRWTDPAEGHAG